MSYVKVIVKFVGSLFMNFKVKATVIHETCFSYMI